MESLNAGFNIANCSQDSQGVQSSTGQEGESQKSGEAEATIASRLLLIASIISNLTEEDFWFVISSIISLTASFLIWRAALLEAEEQQIAPGVTTFANKLKITGSLLSLGVSIISLWALLIEISLRQTPTIAQQPTQAGTTGALFVG